MQPTTSPAMRSIDVTGLPDEAVRALETLVDTWRKEKPAVPPREVPLWQRPHEEWVQALREWIYSHPRCEHVVDWSRESVYSDDGR